MFYFHPYLGRWSNFDKHMFQMGWWTNHQLVWLIPPDVSTQTPNPKPQTSLANEASRGDHWCMFFNRPSSNAWGLVCRCWTPGIWWPVDGQMVGRFGVYEKCIFMFVHALNVGYNIYEFMSICNMYAAMHYCWAFSIIIRHVRSVCLLPFLHHWPLIRSRHGAIKIFNLCKQLVSQ